MNVLVVSPGSGWILDNLADRIAKAGGYGRLEMPSAGPADNPDVVLYVDVQNCWNRRFHGAVDAKHIGLFTHLHGDDDASFEADWRWLDGVVHMCTRYKKAWERCNYVKPMVVIPPTDVPFPLKPVRFGVCQRGGHVGKGDPFMWDVLKGIPRQFADHMEFRFKGGGWFSDRAHIPFEGGPGVLFEPNEGRASYMSFYRMIDYLVIPSLWEGGPMALVEALGTGTPVITPDVGWVNDLLPRWDAGSPQLPHGCEMYPTGNHAALAQCLCNKVIERQRLRDRVEHLSFESFVSQFEEFVRGLTKA